MEETSQFPYSAVCKLTINASKGRVYISTGFVVAPRVILTGAYGLYMHDGPSEDQGFVKSVKVAPGQKGETLPFGEIVSTEFKVTGEWKDGANLDRAIGAIILPEPLKGTGALPLRSLPDDVLVGAPVRILGYPMDRSSSKDLYVSTGHITAASATGLNHDLDTAGGTGGAPVLYETSGQTYVVGIHVGSSTNTRAIRLDQATVDMIQRWISESP